MAQGAGAELLKEIPHLDLWLATQKFHRVGDYVDDLVARKRATLAAASSQPESNGRSGFSIIVWKKKSVRHRPFEINLSRRKQSDGFRLDHARCNMPAPFASLPRTRGAERSRTIAEIVSEVSRAVADGVKEVTLLGQIVNLYGRHEFPAVPRVAGRGQAQAPSCNCSKRLCAVGRS